jgi:hypothetical protein
VVVIGNTLTTVPVGKAPVGTATESVVDPEVSVVVSGAFGVTFPDTGVPYEEVATPEGGGAFVAGGLPWDTTLAVTVSPVDVTAR